MRHRRRIKTFSRKFNHRKAMFRSLVGSLVEHERIATTVEKAKELRHHIERAITIGKENSLSNRRLLMSRFPRPEVVGKIMADLSPRFKSRPGGYTRIIKIGRRPGDTAEMAFIEFVDYDYTKHGAQASEETAAPVKGKKSKSAKAADAAPKKAAKSVTTKDLVAAKKKSAKKIQKKSRAASRV
jgi:large subunit ribosomal protein L17